MDVFDAIKKRRSHRSFQKRPIEPEKIEKILEAAQWAPSPANSQPCEFVIVSNAAARERIRSLSETAKKHGNFELRGFSYVRPMPQALTEAEPAAEEEIRAYPVSFLQEAPVLIAVVGNPRASVRQRLVEQANDAYKYSCAAAIENMLLAATGLGLGSLWFTLFEQDSLRQLLQIDSFKHVVAIVCLGYPAKEPAPPPRMPLEKKVKRID